MSHVTWQGTVIVRCSSRRRPLEGAGFSAGRALAYNAATTALREGHSTMTTVLNPMRSPAVLTSPRRCSTPAAVLLMVLLFGITAADLGAQEESTLLEGVMVADGSIGLGGLSTMMCLPVNNLPFGGRTFTVHTSKWQRRATADDAWEDVPDTEEMGQVCPLSPEEPGDYRLIVDGTIDGERGMFHTTHFTKTAADPVPVLPGYAAVWLALLLAGLLLRARRTVSAP